MTVVVRQRGDLEPVAVYPEFIEIVHKMDDACRRGVTFLITEKEDTRPVAFAIHNVLRIEEI